MSGNKRRRYKGNFISYTELKKYIKENNLSTREEYFISRKVNNLYNGKYLPSNPSTFYTDNIWEGWSIIIRGRVYKKMKLYYKYEECKSVIQKYNFKSKSDYTNRISDVIKLDIRIPYSPPSVYKNWISWIDFLQSDNIYCNDNKYKTYEESQKWARNLNFKNTKQWRDLDLMEIPNNIPKKPERTYKNNGWVDWYDFLGIDKRSKMSYGEILIHDILNEYKILFIFNKSLKDCKNKSKLRFDFYIPSRNLCIEFDGIQHFKPVSIFGGLDGFIDTKLRDGIKNTWCHINNIKLIRFNYLQSKEDIYEQIKNTLNV